MIFVIKTPASHHNIAPLHIKSITPIYYDETTHMMKFQIDIGSLSIISIYIQLGHLRMYGTDKIEKVKTLVNQAHSKLMYEWSRFSDPNKAHLVHKMEFIFPDNEAEDEPLKSKKSK